MDFIHAALFLLLSCSSVFGDSTRVQDEKLDHLENALGQVVDENNALEAKLSQLQKELTVLDKKKQELTEKISELETVIDKQKNDISSLRDTCRKHDGERGEAMSMSSHKRQVRSAWIGFTAVISQADVTNLTPGQPIVFDKIITNMADAYNASTGHFSAPSKGVYAFNMAVLVEPDHNEYLEFIKDGNHVMYNYAHARGSLHDVSSSRTVVLELDAGNQVWVQTAPNSQHGSGTIHGNDFSSFSGWLLAYTQDVVSIIG